jgi:imidazolonepropionase-like amidohydrolase
LRALRLVFSPRDISKILGQGAARSTLKQDQIGTLEAGKFADMVLIDGNPLIDINDVLNVMMTIKNGRIVSDMRRPRR